MNKDAVTGPHKENHPHPHQDAHSHISGGSNTNHQYKPHSYQDYQTMKQQVQTLKLGGLGANIGSEEWEKARKKNEFFMEYGKQIRM
jgi:hypothetical protein